MLETLSEEERRHWAKDVLYQITYKRIAALDIAGWKIVRKVPEVGRHGGDVRWLFNSGSSGYPCPDWCEDFIPCQRSFQGKQKGMSEQDRQHWAATIMEELIDEYAVALDIAGWKIVRQGDPAYRWPFNSKQSGYKCPDWCEDCYSNPSRSSTADSAFT